MKTKKVDIWKKSNKVSEVYNELFISIAISVHKSQEGGENTEIQEEQEKLHISSHLTIKDKKRKWCG